MEHDELGDELSTDANWLWFFTKGYKATILNIGTTDSEWIEGDLQGFDTSKNFTTASNLPRPSPADDLRTRAVDIECKGLWADDMANITNVAVRCSKTFGTARRADRGDSRRIYDFRSHWSLPMYTCATAIKAAVKVIRLSRNDTHTLENLRVDKVVPRRGWDHGGRRRADRKWGNRTLLWRGRAR
ncbi:hypothetical protein HOY80DRAFT_1085551 [Tuber brumale]|nr:hypothetical protein HOY80DRAFT_1085551 [Tuber brumale]